MPEVGSLFVRLRADASEFQRALQGAAQGLKDVGDQIAGVGKDLSKSVTAPLLGAAAAAVKIGMGFDAEMSKVQALTGATGDEFAALRVKAREMGEATRFSASQAAEAMQFMALAGWDTDQILQGISGTLALASAAGLDLARTSDIVTDTMAAFGLAASDVMMISDQFAVIQARTNTSVEQLGEAMKYVGPTANAMNMDIAETNALLGMLANQAIKGSSGGTTLNAVLSSMIGNVKDGMLEFGSFSVALEDAQGNFRPMGDVIRDIAAATEGMTDAQKVNALSSVFNRQAMRGMLAILNEGPDAYDALVQAQIDGTGAALEMAATMEDNLAGALTTIKSRVEDLMIELSDVLTPIIRAHVIPAINAFIDAIKGGLVWFKNLDDGVKTTVVAILGIAAAIGPVLIAIGTAIKVLGVLAGVVTAVLTPVGLLVVAIGALAAAFATDFMGIRTAVMGVLGPIIALVTGELMPVFAALKDVIANLFAGDLAAAAASLGDVWSALTGMDWGAIGAAIWDALGELGTALLGLAGDIYGWVSTAIAGVDWAGLGQTLLGYAETALGVLGDLGSAALDLAGALYGWIAEQVGTIDWPQLGRDIWEALSEAVAAGVATAREIGTTIYDWVSEQAAGVDWSGVGTSIVDGISGALDTAWAAVDATGLLDPLVSAFETARDALAPLASAIVAALEPIWNNIKESGAPILEELKNLWDQLKPALDAVIPLLKVIGVVIGGVLVVALGVVLGALSGFVGLLTGALPGAIQAVTGVIRIFTGVIEGITATVGGTVKIIAALLRGDWRGAWEAAKEAVVGVVSAIGTIIGGLKDLVVGLIRGLVGSVVGLISGFVSSILNFFTTLYERLVGNSIIPDMVNGIVRWIAQLPGRVLAIISELVVSVLSRMAEFAGDMLAKGGELIGNVADGMLSMLSTAVGAINDIVDAVLEVVSDAGEWLWDTGVNVVTGLWNGIKSMAAWIKDRVTGFVQDVIPGPIRRALGIESPSRVTAEFGRELVRGFVVGMEDGELELTKASADLAKSVVGAMRDVFALARDLAGLAPDALDIAVEYLEYLPWLGRQLLIQMAKGRDLFEGPVLEEIEKLSAAVSSTFRAIRDVIGVAQELAGRDPWDLDIAVEYLEYLPWLGRAMLTQFVEGVSLFAGPVLEGAEKLASAVSAAFGAAGDALNFLGAAGELDPLDLARDLSGTMARINDLATVAVAGLAELADRFGTEAVEAGEKAGAAVQGAFGGLLTGIEYVTTAAGLNPRRMGERLNQVTDLLHDQVARAMERMADLTALIGPARLAEIKAAADGITTIFAALTQALDLSDRLGARRGTRAADDALAGLVRFAGRAVEIFAATFVDEGRAMEAAGVSLIERLETGIARQAESLLSLVRAIAQEAGATLASVGLAPGGVVVSPPSLEGMTSGSAQRFERQLQQLTAQLAGGGAAGAAAGMPEGVYVGQIVVPVDIGGQRFETVILDVVNGQLRRVL